MQNQLKIILILCTIFSFARNGYTQDCEFSFTHSTLNGNNIKATIPINGNLFCLANIENQFQNVTNSNSPSFPSTFFSTGIWLAGKDDLGNLKLAVATEQTPTRNDFFSGPILNENGIFSFQCDNFNRTWEVYGYEISQHISDFADNGIIDNPIQNIYAYPGLYNPHFENIHGFPLPNTSQGLAPFFDQNNDGIYNPDVGDFPLPEGVSENKIPKHIIWGIFNDGGGEHTLSGGEPLNIEVQLTAYSFYCDEDELLNNTIFNSHKVINRGNEILDSIIFTKWVDFNLGCNTDDYFGCIPGLNTFYSYNEDAEDGTTGLVCNFEIPTFGTNPPVQAVTILNQELTSFNYYSQFSLFIGPYTKPTSPQSFYNFMHGNWGDGSDATYGGDAYNSGGQPVNYLFPHNPNDSLGWSMTTAYLPYVDRRSLANIEFDGQFIPNDFFKIDMAYTFYQDSTLNNIETVNLVYEHTPTLQQLYDNGFEDCELLICQEDCVWTGDANQDSIVSTLDFLQVGLAQGQSGVQRNKPLIWQPFEGENWNQQIYDIDLKHTDCNGNGIIENTDFNLVESYFGNSYKSGNTINEYQIGKEIGIVSHPNFSIDQFQYGALGRGYIELKQADDIYGLVFTLEFDTTFLRIPINLPFFPLWENQLNVSQRFSKVNNENGTVDYAYVKTDGLNSTSQIGSLSYLVFSTKPNNYELVQTYLRIKNIKAILNDGTYLDYGARDFLVNIINPDGTGQILSNENLEEFNIQIFPNPTSDILNIKMENPTSAHFTIFDIYGKKVFEKTDVNQNEIQLNTSNFSQGIYFLKIEMEGKELVKKFIKL